jgi:hypothetical protein
VEQTIGYDRDACARGEQASISDSVGFGTAEPTMKHLLETLAMSFRIAAALSAPLLAGAPQSLHAAIGLRVIAPQSVVAVHTVVAPLAEAAPPPAEQTRGRKQYTPEPGFVGPGPGWG